jgi:hypothetical protein
LHEVAGAITLAFVGRGMVMYPEKAPTSYTRSPEPEIAEKHFGFEFWLTVGLFLFLAVMIIAQKLF